MCGKRDKDADVTEDHGEDEDEDSPRDTAWKEKRRLVRVAKKPAVEGARDQVWNNHKVRQAVAERFQFFLLLFFAGVVFFLFFSARMLLEDVRSSLAAWQWLGMAQLAQEKGVSAPLLHDRGLVPPGRGDCPHHLPPHLPTEWDRPSAGLPH